MEYPGQDFQDRLEGIVINLGREPFYIFSSPDTNPVEFFTSIKWQPTISEFGILSLLNAILMTSLTAIVSLRRKDS